MTTLATITPYAMFIYLASAACIPLIFGCLVGMRYFYRQQKRALFDKEYRSTKSTENLENESVGGIAGTIVFFLLTLGSFWLMYFAWYSGGHR